MDGDNFVSAMKQLGFGIAWAGFWIGLGLYNFQGCAKGTPSYEIIKEVSK